jgi:hypothetical protein
VDHRRQTVVTLAEILVEVMATRRGQTFLEPGALIGPHPSGAPAIFIDQVARLGDPPVIELNAWLYDRGEGQEQIWHSRHGGKRPDEGERQKAVGPH